MGDWVWVAWGWATLVGAGVVAVIVVLSPSYRRRYQRGGRSLTRGLVLLPIAVLPIVLDRYTDASPEWAGRAFLVSMLLLSGWTRRQLAAMPPEALSPFNAAWLERPRLSELVRNPVAGVRAHVRFIERWGELRRAEKAWDRQQELAGH